MISTLVLVATHAVAVVAGAFAWPHVSSLYTSWQSSHAVKAAKALIDRAEADAKALEAAKKVVATATVTAATSKSAVAQIPAATAVAAGATGATGA